MNKINCIIVDDEISGRIVLKELFDLYCPNISIKGEANNINEAYDLIKEQQPDLVFLDIQMPGGDGFDLLRKFEVIDFDVIFVTSFDKYAINAIKFSALDYLLKPVEVSELLSSVEKVQKRKEKNIISRTWLINLLDNLDDNNKERKIAVHYNDKVRLLKLSAIIFFEAESNYTNIYTCDGERYKLARIIKDFEMFLEKHENFMRINKSIIINLDYVSEYSKGEPCFIFLNNGKEFEISRRKKKEVIEKILIRIKEKGKI